MEISELEKVLDHIDLKLEPIKLELKHIDTKLEKFINNARWVAAVIVVPLLFFVLDKIF